VSYAEAVRMWRLGNAVGLLAAGRDIWQRMAYLSRLGRSLENHCCSVGKLIQLLSRVVSQRLRFDACYEVTA
jgi:hypothetical protein